MKHTRLMEYGVRNLVIAVFLTAFGLFSAAPQAARATTVGVTVNTFTDVVSATDGYCSLREAVAAANTNAPSGAVAGECRAGVVSGADTIQLDTGTYTLTGGSLDLTSSMWIIGEGIGATIVEAATNPNTAVEAVFEVSGDEVVIAHLTERYGGVASGGSGGGIIHTGSGDLTLYAVEVYWNKASYSGGGIYSSSTGALNIVDSIIRQNNLDGIGVVATDIHGAGIDHNLGDLLIVNSTIRDNVAGYTSLSGLGAVGGGIRAAGSSFNMFYSTVSGNSTMTIDRFSFGGGVATSVTGALISHSTLSNNAAMTVANDNRGAGGGIGNYGSLTVRNSTISGNQAFSGFQSGGGGLANWNSSASASLVQVTLTGNRVGTASAGGLSDMFGAGVDTASGAISAANTVISGNTSTLPPGEEQCGAALSFTGASADDDATCFSGAGAINAGAYNLGALADNGGRTQTVSVGLGSDLIDAGDAATCSAAGIDSLDQRRAPRPGTGATTCTIGAFEFNGVPPTLADAFDDTGIGTDEDTPLTVALPGVLGNDLPAFGLDAHQAPTGDFSYDAPTGPSHATFTLNANGSYSYTPVEDFNGYDPFLYWITDSPGGTHPYDMALAMFKVQAVNDAPTFTPPIFDVTEDLVGSITGLSVDDPDMYECPGATIKVTLSVLHGTLTLTILPPTLTSVTGNGTGTVVIIGSIEDVNTALADIDYLGDLDYNGAETLTVTVSDQGYCDGDETGGGGDPGDGGGGEQHTDPDEASFPFTIAPANDAPINTVPGTQTAVVDTPLNITGVSVYDVDLFRGEGTVQLQVTLTVTNGTVSVTGPAGVTVTGNGTNVVVISGAYADVLDALTPMTFTSDLGFVGTATIQVLSDDLGNDPPPAAIDTDSFDITVGPAPVCAFPNCSFESPIGANKFPSSWRRSGLILPADGTDTATHTDGNQSFRFKANGEAKKIYQDIALSGPAGNALNLAFSWRGNKVTGKTGMFRVMAVLYYTDGTAKKFYINMPIGTHGWTEYNLPITATKAYNKLRIQVDFGKTTGTVRFDNFRLTD